MSQMGEVTIPIAELRELRREMQETKWLAYGLIQRAVGKERADQTLEDIRDWIDHPYRRYSRGTPLYTVVWFASEALQGADLYTLEEVAARPRGEVAAVKGVGKVALGRIEAALAEHGLTWAEAA